MLKIKYPIVAFGLIKLTIAVYFLLLSDDIGSRLRSSNQRKNLLDRDYEQIESLRVRVDRGRYGIDCKRLFEMDRDEQAEAVKLLSSLKKNNSDVPLIPDSSFILNQSECESFRLLRGYGSYNVSQLELEFPLAFIILVDNQIEQFERVLRLIYRPHNLYCVHVDLKSSTTVKQAIKSIAGCFDNIFIATKTENVTWGRYELLQAELNCMSDLLNQRENPSFIKDKKSADWQYVINLASTMMPLKTNYELTRILRAYNRTNEVEIIKAHEFKSRYEYVWDQMGITGTKKSPPPNNMTILKGSNYVALSHEFAAYVNNGRESKQLQTWLKDTFIPDEYLWATLLYHSPRFFPQAGFRDEVNKSYLHTMSIYIIWHKGELIDTCHSTWRHWICMFSLHDLPSLATKPHFFANKFLLAYDPLSYQCMEDWYLAKARQEFSMYINLKPYCDLHKKRSTLIDCGLNFQIIPPP